jgi:hypothetical protein
VVRLKLYRIGCDIVSHASERTLSPPGQSSYTGQSSLAQIGMCQALPRQCGDNARAIANLGNKRDGVQTVAGLSLDLPFDDLAGGGTAVATLFGASFVDTSIDSIRDSVDHTSDVRIAIRDNQLRFASDADNHAAGLIPTCTQGPVLVG